jgi:hypothetical protein
MISNAVLGTIVVSSHLRSSDRRDRGGGRKHNRGCGRREPSYI